MNKNDILVYAVTVGLSMFGGVGLYKIREHFLAKAEGVPEETIKLVEKAAAISEELKQKRKTNEEPEENETDESPVVVEEPQPFDDVIDIVKAIEDATELQKNYKADVRKRKVAVGSVERVSFDEFDLVDEDQKVYITYFPSDHLFADFDGNILPDDEMFKDVLDLLDLDKTRGAQYFKVPSRNLALSIHVAVITYEESLEDVE